MMHTPSCYARWGKECSCSMDQGYRVGNPASIVCRGCDAKKIAQGAGLLCPTCDGGVR